MKNHGSERNYRLRHRYGITEAEADRMHAEQGGLCAICREGEAEHVDHCHETGRVRGLLCFNCNNGLGHFRDDLRVMDLAVLYLLGQVPWPEGDLEPCSAPRREPAPTRSYHLTGRYRITAADADRMLDRQKGWCVVCWMRPAEHVDHDHDTGGVRHALCLPCNSGLGQFRDSARVVEAAIHYLREAWGETTDEEEIARLAAAEDEAWRGLLEAVS
ncbi:hypothetical protein Ppa06_23700 [Planomonospora parontospora subsp. parontospora]|uniref:Recombination endonuclease VII n=2 Tax=Planomonospora parontospora TaxID=58119 RepID=A0AA37F4K3_9ACTN|nr:endonuclease VII domain-containing protein [Planomonospora parontospora]GGK67020.1 hypothetical protein GCM10010126_28110 [Planomonospora parontospora]GII08572.1 hypothetical protein Ppa06_23700 [Planomonospora parontospora subsp. parontospora]